MVCRDGCAVLNPIELGEICVVLKRDEERHSKFTLLVDPVLP